MSTATKEAPKKKIARARKADGPGDGLTVATFRDHLQNHVAGELAARSARARFARQIEELKARQATLERQIADAQEAARALHPAPDADTLIDFAQANLEVFGGEAKIEVAGGKMTKKDSLRVEIVGEGDEGESWTEDDACEQLIAHGYGEAVKTTRKVQKQMVGEGKLVPSDIANLCGIEIAGYCTCTIKIG